jgi:hypothetical protein
MQNLLLVGNKEELAIAEVNFYISANSISPTNVYRFNSHPAEFNVEEFREMLKLTERHFDSPTLFIIENFETISEVMQNTFLKTLEEHQENLVFVLISRNLSKVLPTVRSRCQVVNLQNKIPSLTPADKLFFENLLQKLQKNPHYLVSFEAALGIKNKKEKALTFLDNFLAYAHSLLPRFPKQTVLANYTRRAIEIRELIENNNLDPEMAIDQVFLS